MCKYCINLKIVFVLFFVLYHLTLINASDIIALSTEQIDVQNAVDTAITGDTVFVPSGTSTWNSKVTIPNDKKITIQGAGVTETIINGNAITMNQSGSRITGFRFNSGEITVDGDDWRIDHCYFYADSFSNGVRVNGNRKSLHPRGLVDNSTFVNQRVLVLGWLGLLAHDLWFEPITLGSDYDTVYIEDCTFSSTEHANAIDSNYGGRYVFRHNILNDIYIEAHSVQGNHRASRSWEIYDNTINQITRSMWTPMYLRGGTGVVFNNAITGNWSLPKPTLNNKRDQTASSVCGICDGSSPWDGNTSGEGGYPCRDQIGRGADLNLWTDANPYPPQTLDPVYGWNNTYNSSNVTFTVANQSPIPHILEGRDFYNEPKPGYIPFTYPHPLREGESSIPEDPEPETIVPEPPTKIQLN
ncbi:MAG: hypothetical protein JEY91_15350 [Spirochaetaceae bacterium]|nr:hypothetical protein [Spirochaetaceae bacterium]